MKATPKELRDRDLPDNVPHYWVMYVFKRYCDRKKKEVTEKELYLSLLARDQYGQTATWLLIQRLTATEKAALAAEAAE